MKSQAQRAYLWMHHPEIAKRWEKVTPQGKKLPEHVKKAVEKIAKTLRPDTHIKTAEPPPPKGISVEEWDKILQRGPQQKKKTNNTSMKKRLETEKESAYYLEGVKQAFIQLGL